MLPGSLDKKASVKLSVVRILLLLLIVLITALAYARVQSKPAAEMCDNADHQVAQASDTCEE
ncbi:hypothetical protein [Ruegeria sp.]|uniref:hypothetical protein n=1 Tax=Ruegeria sp. TaxID=1879320 RepID=UPI003C7B418B